MADNPSYSAYEVSFEAGKVGAQSAMQRSLSSIKSTMKTFENFFDPIIVETKKTADAITYRMYVASNNVKQLENKLKELQTKIGIDSGVRDEMGIPIRSPSIVGMHRLPNVNLDRSRVTIDNKRDAAAMRAKAAQLGYSIKKADDQPNDFFLNMPASTAKTFHRDIRRSNQQYAQDALAEEQARKDELARKKSSVTISGGGGAGGSGGSGGGSVPGGGMERILRSGGRSLLIIYLLTELVKFVKMIFGAVIEAANVARKDIRDSSSTGVNVTRVGQYRAFAKSKGMDEDVYTNSFNSINSKFGNITKLDQGALESLALVMGSGIKNLVTSGIGGDDPEELLKQIIDAFTNRAMSGQNSVGMNVGISAATRELTEYLKKIDPNWASIFTTKMTEVYNPLMTDREKDNIRNGGLMWDNGVITNLGGVNDIDQHWMSTLKKSMDELGSMMKQLSEMFGRWASPMVAAMTSFTKGFVMKFGTAQQKQKYYDENMKNAQERLEKNKVHLEDVNSRTEEARASMKEKYGINVSDEDLYRLSIGEMPASLAEYVAPDRDKFGEFRTDAAKLAYLASAKGRLGLSIRSLKKEASVTNATPGETDMYEFEKISSDATRTAQGVFADHYGRVLGVRGRGQESWYTSAYSRRDFTAGVANKIQGIGESELLRSMMLQLYNSTGKTGQSATSRIEFVNKDNELTIMLKDKDGRTIGSASTQVGLATVAGSGSVTPEDLGLANNFPTHSSGTGGAYKAPMRPTSEGVKRSGSQGNPFM